MPDVNFQIFKTLSRELAIKPGNFVPAKDVKEKLGFIYKSLGIHMTPKGSDIEKFYHVKVSTASRGGKVVKGFSIMGSKWNCSQKSLLINLDRLFTYFLVSLICCFYSCLSSLHKYFLHCR